MVFLTGLANPEGPVALAGETWLIVEGGAERGCVTHISADGDRYDRKGGEIRVVRQRDPAGCAAGMEGAG